MAPFAEWVPTLRKLESTIICTPRDLSGISYFDIMILIDLWKLRHRALSLWRASSIMPRPMRGRHISLPMAHNASPSAQSFRDKEIDDSAPTRRRRDSTDDLDPPSNFDSAWPGACVWWGGVKAVALTSGETADIDRFPDSGVASNFTRQKIDYLPIAAAEISRYAEFPI